jgi:alkylation response protein AidB-like acyl-CoA dehydrogenase
MDLTPSPEHQAFQAEVEAFIATHRHLAPKRGAGLLDESVRRWQALLIQHGYAARTIPTEYGGYGAAPDILKSRIVAETFARHGVPGGIANQGVSMFVPTLLQLGREDQKRAWIAPTLRGEVIWCQGYSEPGAGSDLASLATRAVEDGDDFVINGQKIWTSTAKQADMMFCLVRTEPDAPKHAGISYLIFSMKTPGIEVRPLKTLTGQAEFNEVFFTDVRVPKHQIVGERGQGWAVANATLTHERGMLGDPNAAEARLVELAALMKAEGAADNPVLLDRLMRLQARAMAMKYNGLRVLTAAANGDPPGMAGLIIKLQGCELNHQIAALALDVMGELGLIYGSESEHQRAGGAWQHRYMFDLGLIIGGGTAQVQKNIIGERGLGMPREAKWVEGRA